MVPSSPLTAAGWADNKLNEMEERFGNHPNEVSRMNTAELRSSFLINGLMKKGEVNAVYSHYDRMIVGGVVPEKNSLNLTNYDALRSEYFLERREMGIILIAGEGEVTADGKTFPMKKLDCLYIGKGTKHVSFTGTDAKFYFLSCPAHAGYPTTLMNSKDASPAELGSAATSNHRTIYKYIHLDGIRSCQLVMGLTILQPGSVWNTMPAHTHTRRMEVYLYFDLATDQRVFHLMGEPTETRHIVVAAEDAVISPPWSIHSGCGTSNYSFIWGMAGENQAFTDMDAVSIQNLK
jgi:4-deoxy-L-threo-5-hexosulose-uronate ketol-isomerase